MDSLPLEILYLILDPSNFHRKCDDDRYPDARSDFPVLPRGIILERTLREEARKEKLAYQDLRLVNKTFSAIITPHVFKRLRIASSEYSLDRLKSIAQEPELSSLVKRYTYTFGILAADPDRILNLPDSAYFTVRSRPEEERPSVDSTDTHDRQNAKSYEQICKKLEFEQSNDLHAAHLNNLSVLPNLNEINIQITKDELHSTSSEVPQRGKSRSAWRPIVFRAILMALGQRVNNGLAPVEHLTVDGMTYEYVMLSKNNREKAIAGLRHLKSLHCRISSYEFTPSFAVQWHVLFGELLQNCEELEELDIGTAISYEGPGYISDVEFRELFSPLGHNKPRPSDRNPKLQYFKNLKNLHLQKVVFSNEELVRFLGRHKATLKEIRLEMCRLRRPQAMSPIDDPNPEFVDKSWPAIFRDIKKLFPPETLDYLRLSNLYWSGAPEKVFRHELTLEWQQWILAEEDQNEPTPPEDGLYQYFDPETLAEMDSPGSEYSDGFGYGLFDHHAYGYGYEEWEDTDGELSDGFDDEDDGFGPGPWGYGIEDDDEDSEDDEDDDDETVGDGLGPDVGLPGMGVIHPPMIL